jgi:hypothetical protein
MVLESERHGRSTFTKAKRVRCAPAARRAKLEGEIGNPGQRRTRVTAHERLDDRGDVVAMRDQPARQRVDEPSDECRTDDRRRNA